jgi:poly(3-hydroxybutyrate) depolymerase
MEGALRSPHNLDPADFAPLKAQADSAVTADVQAFAITIEGGGHQWPGGFAIPMLGENTDLVSASLEMWGSPGLPLR